MRSGTSARPDTLSLKPGESGNPKGRPRKPKSLATYLKKALFCPVTVKVNGKVRRMPLVEAIVSTSLTTPPTGDPRA